MSDAPNKPFWGILEQMGHVRLGGLISQEELFGTVMGRIDVPRPSGAVVTRYFGGQTVYALTPCDEATARAVALHCDPAPVHAYELPRLPGPQEGGTDYVDPDPFEEEDDA